MISLKDVNKDVLIRLHIYELEKYKWYNLGHRLAGVDTINEWCTVVDKNGKYFGIPMKSVRVLEPRPNIVK